jgi:alanyl-tRNA synthetase
VLEKIMVLQEQARELDRTHAILATQKQEQWANELLQKAITVHGVPLIAARAPDCDPKLLREMVDRLKQKLHSGVVILGTVSDRKISLVAGVTPDRVGQISAKEVVNVVAHQVGGQGGGRADLAQAGGVHLDRLDAALDSVRAWITTHQKG